MKAIQVREFGPLNKLDYADLPDPEPGPREVLVQAEAIGVNFPDGLMVQGLYQVKPDLPFVPGMEVAGRVIARGAEVEDIYLGDRVVGVINHGGYAERVALDQRAAITLPEDVSTEDACAMMCGYGTAQHALKQRGKLQPGETLCVLGASGLTGIGAVQIGKAMGARVIGVASTPAKRDIAKAAGADIVLGYENLKDTLKEATGGKGVDVAFDPVGGEVFDALSRAMAWEGRLLVVGFASGTIPKFPVNLALLKGFSVVGVFWGAFTARQPETYARNVQELFDWHREGKIRPVIEGRYKLADAGSVLERVLSRGASGKLVLIP